MSSSASCGGRARRGPRRGKPERVGRPTHAVGGGGGVRLRGRAAAHRRSEPSDGGNGGGGEGGRDYSHSVLVAAQRVFALPPACVRPPRRPFPGAERPPTRPPEQRPPRSGTRLTPPPRSLRGLGSSATRRVSLPRPSSRDAVSARRRPGSSPPPPPRITGAPVGPPLRLPRCQTPAASASTSRCRRGPSSRTSASPCAQTKGKTDLDDVAERRGRRREEKDVRDAERERAREPEPLRHASAVHREGPDAPWPMRAAARQHMQPATPRNAASADVFRGRAARRLGQEEDVQDAAQERQHPQRREGARPRAPRRPSSTSAPRTKAKLCHGVEEARRPRCEAPRPSHRCRCAE